ncbi:protein ASPARTIC PROTEASE IN GUARD CELL 1-like [Solanum tuberosum]|uniref:41 kD chloroplast nucleoid DNA binding protein (CND41) n=1 Tax=Solanum tuberosum TaxID=4113 RepID=M1B6K1_SOLTU|nr:PREDICTED: protein ASPARTIC PROTEASE IN GUARD CELL 1-like [Solanum tuberosum]
MALINKLIFFLVYFGYGQILPILGENHLAPPHYKVVNISSLLPKPYCQKSTSGPAIGSQKLKIVSRHGPCFPNAKTPSSDSEQLMNWDEVRVRSINKKPKKTPSFLSNYDYGGYTVKIGLGTPRQNFFLMFDTGSPATWVRCKSCTKGCKSNNHLYDPSVSSTHTNNKSGCNGSFSVSYRDDSSIEGIWGCDTFTGDDRDIGQIQNFRFVCGQNLKGDFDEMDGILGLGKGDSSVTSQIPSMQMFSYFIPLTSSRMGNLYFGNEAMDRSKDCLITQFTALVDGQCKDCYYVDLIGISVAGNKLDVSSRMLASRETIIDSGTVITQLPEEVYSALRDAFRQSMLAYTLLEKADKLMDTCYTVKKPLIIPEIKFHFGKENTIDVSLSESGILWTPTESMMCLAFTSAKDNLSIIGSVQQRGMNVIYDLKQKRIGFGTNCPTY